MDRRLATRTRRDRTATRSAGVRPSTVALGSLALIAVVTGGLLGQTVLGGPASRDAPVAGPVVATDRPSITPPVPGHEMYGFVPYWEIDDTIAAHVRTTAPSTVALFSVTHTVKGAIATNQNGYRAIHGPVGRRVIADAHADGRRVDVTWTSFGQGRNRTLFASDALQDAVIASLVRLRADLDVDGVAVDVEEIGATDIPTFGSFVERLRLALRAAAPTATVTVATGAGPQGAALAFAATIAGADRIFLMGYDYRTAASEPGASAPLVRRDGTPRSLSWSLDLYAAAGVPAERTILGLPLYGLAWPTAAPDLGAPGTGRGDIWVPRRHLEVLRDAKVSAEIEPIESVAFLAVPDGSAWQAVYYDTPESLAPKLELANERGLAGAGFWALGYERGLSGYGGLIGDFRAGRPMTAMAVAP